MDNTERIEHILGLQYECRMISSGENYPKVNIKENHLMDICILLHNGFSLSDINSYFAWSEDELYSRLNILLEENLIREKDNEGFTVACMVITAEDGDRIYQQTMELAKQTVKLIVNNLDKIKLEIYTIETFKFFDFYELSFFVLSDVLLDAVQINNVESEFLKSERTKRNGMNYYYSIQENDSKNSKEAFGIYGNMYRQYGEIAYGIYGNERNNVNFCTMEKEFIRKNFGCDNILNISQVKEKLLKEILKKHNCKDYEMDETIKSGFNKLGIMYCDKVKIPIFSQKDFSKLNNIADIIKSDYIEIFEKYRGKLHRFYQESRYTEAVSFEEYFLWWYHFFYTRVTDCLIEKGIISLPKNNNVNYIIV